MKKKRIEKIDGKEKEHTCLSYFSLLFFSVEINPLLDYERDEGIENLTYFDQLRQEVLYYFNKDKVILFVCGLSLSLLSHVYATRKEDMSFLF